MATFNEIINGEKPVLIDFSADWCGPCQQLAPILKELVDQMDGRIRVIKIDVDKNSALATKYQIFGVPTMLLFENGVEKWRQSGLSTANELKSEIESRLS